MTNVRDLFDLSDRVALVTGGGTGLGRQLAIALAEAGADVALVGRRQVPLESAAAEIRRIGRRAAVIPADVSDPLQVRAIVGQVGEALGSVGILVNNAATHHRAPVVSQAVEEWRRVMETNVTAAFLCCQVFAPGMIERRWGRIINVASVYGLVGRDGSLYAGEEPGMDWVESLPYATSKGALINFTRDLAVNWGRYGITVNAVSPGMFGRMDETGRLLPLRNEQLVRERTPLGRRGCADDLKGAVVFLASDAAAFVTGHNLVVDGGWTAW